MFAHRFITTSGIHFFIFRHIFATSIFTIFLAMNFLEFLKQHTPLSEKCEKALYLATTPLIMEANSTLLSPNQISDKIYFVEKGLLRTYYYADA